MTAPMPPVPAPVTAKVQDRPIPTRLSKRTPGFVPMTIGGDFITWQMRRALRDHNDALALDVAKMYALTWPELQAIGAGTHEVAGDNFTGYRLAAVVGAAS